jgi:hypothetical protein
MCVAILLVAGVCAQEEAAPKIGRMPPTATPIGRWQVTVTEAPHKVVAVDTVTGTMLTGALSADGIQWDEHVHDLPEIVVMQRAWELAKKEKREKEEKRRQGLTQEQRDEEDLQKLLPSLCRGAPQIFVAMYEKEERTDGIRRLGGLYCKVTEFLKGEGLDLSSENRRVSNTSPAPILKVGDEYRGLYSGDRSAKAGDWCVVFQGGRRIPIPSERMTFNYKPDAVLTRDWELVANRGFSAYKNLALTVDAVKAALKKLDEEE